MLVRRHEKAAAGTWCEHCGVRAQGDGTFSEYATCREREDGQPGPAAPRRVIACEDTAAMDAARGVLETQRAEASLVAGCFAMQDRSINDCEQCAGRDCMVCAVRKSEPVKTCLLCYAPSGSRPCPSRQPANF